MNPHPIELSFYDFDLPQHLIAQFPIEPRDHAKLLIYFRSQDRIEHRHIYDLPEYLNENDLLVLNNSKVIPARLFATGKEGGRLEVFLIEPLQLIDNQFVTAEYGQSFNREHFTYWKILCKPSKRFHRNDVFALPKGGWIEILEVNAKGERIGRIDFPPGMTFEQWLNQAGTVPLPPYIERKPNEQDKNRYQTIYASSYGSVAAPTAGLHFTEQLLQKIKSKNISIAELTLHVGLGTFQPIRAQTISDHSIMPEVFELPFQTIQQLNKTKEKNGRIVAVGTTSTRVLETFAWRKVNQSLTGKSDLYIYPGYQFQVVDALLTNFHLPKSSLFLLVCAFLGREKALEIYKIAIQENYRFYSYGDACLFL
ncbi:MAG: tRNA preQ1(34) S-adenosylmethionine ribosyltransferase-isomerase QueA [bacterium]|nr:tRNA preQ1(34) S-adenosylmethionine ribosyltransferase-isomerase QueA [bacterium]